MRVTEQLHRGRVEQWQRELDAGSCFALIVHEDVIIYGRVLRRIDESGLVVKTYCEAIPEGATDVIESFMADLPLSSMEMAMAEALHWPSDMKTLRLIVKMRPPADA